jgi:hypothetical protein
MMASARKWCVQAALGAALAAGALACPNKSQSGKAPSAASGGGTGSTDPGTAPAAPSNPPAGQPPSDASKAPDNGAQPGQNGGAGSSGGQKP